MTIKTVDYSDIHWAQYFDGDTYTSDVNTRPTSFENPLSDLFAKDKPPKPTSTGLALPMMRGWEPRQGVPEVTALTDKEIKAAIDQRTQQIETWEASEDALTKQLAETARQVWFPGGKPKAPKYGGNMGFRRGFAIVGSIMLLNYDRKPSFKYSVPVNVVEYDNETDRLMAHIAENVQKTEGVSTYNALDYVDIAAKLVARGGLETDLTKAGVKRGTAQKVFCLAKLSAKFRVLKLVDRVNMEPPKLRANARRFPYSEGCYIPLAVLDKEQLRHLYKGRAAKGDKAAIEPAKTAEQVESYVSDAMRGSTNTQDKAMPKDRMESTAESHAVDIVRIIVDAVRHNKEKVLNDLANKADQINAALEDILK